MNNKLPPEPILCCECGEYFYGRKGAITCSTKCRKRRSYKKDKSDE